MNFKSIFRRVSPILFAGTIFFAPLTANAEIQQYTGEGSYIMSEGENLGVAKERAKADAMRNACEQAGTFVQATTEVANMMVTKDEIITMTGGIVKMLEDPAFAPLKELENLEGVLIHVTVKVSIDSEDVLKWMKKSSSERAQLISQMESLQEANAKQERQIAELKRQLAAATSASERQQIAQGFSAEEDKFMSNQKVKEAWVLKKNGDINGAAKLFGEAIRLDPNNALAYYGRGNAYYDLEQYEQSLQDFNKAIELNPNYTYAYNNRGIAYGKLEQYERAIQDYDKAIELNPNDAEVYYNRGIAYGKLEQYERAIQDYEKAIELAPLDVSNYYNRGGAYFDLKKYEWAIHDYDVAIELNPKHANAYYNRGSCYKELEQYKRAIKDFTAYIELVPNDYAGWKMRGRCYEKLGDNAKAEADFAKAKELGWNG